KRNKCSHRESLSLQTPRGGGETYKNTLLLYCVCPVPASKNSFLPPPFAPQPAQRAAAMRLRPVAQQKKAAAAHRPLPFDDRCFTGNSVPLCVCPPVPGRPARR